MGLSMGRGGAGGTPLEKENRPGGSSRAGKHSDPLVCHVVLDSATALLLGAAFAALGRGLLGVTLCAASTALGVTFFAASTAVGTTASHQAGARQESGDAEPCQELLELLCVHGSPPFLHNDVVLMKTMEITMCNRKIISASANPVNPHPLACQPLADGFFTL
jgi:hypothetical protein